MKPGMGTDSAVSMPGFCYNRRVSPFILCPVHQREHIPPVMQITSVIPLAQVLQDRISLLGGPVRGAYLPQAQLVGGQLFAAVDAADLSAVW